MKKISLKFLNKFHENLNDHSPLLHCDISQILLEGISLNLMLNYTMALESKISGNHSITIIPLSAFWNTGMDHSVIGNSIMGLYKGCECKASLQEVTQGALMLVEFWVLRTTVCYRDKTRDEWCQCGTTWRRWVNTHPWWSLMRRAGIQNLHIKLSGIWDFVPFDSVN